MSFNDVMYGSLGQVNQGFQNNLGLNAANMANSNTLVNSWQNVPQVSQQQLYGGGSFGAQPAAYAALGAAYGRAVPQSSAAAVAAAHPNNVWSTGAPAYNAYGGGADQAWYLGGSQGPRPSEAYNAPRQYGWDHNEGAPAPAAPQVYNRGEFNPQTYGWEHNEGGAPDFGGLKDQEWYRGGSQGPRPSSQSGGDTRGINAFAGDYVFGGLKDQEWWRGGSQGPRPSSQGYIGNPKANAFSYNPALMGDGGFGGAADIQWYLGGSQGPRPSSLSGASSANPYANTPKSQDWQSTFNNMVNGDSANPYVMGGAPWQPSGRNDLAAAMSAAQDRLRAGQGWTIAQQPPAASQGTLTNRINQSIYDIGNAGDAYGRAFGMNLGNPQGLTPQDLVIPHAYPPEVRNPFGMNPNPGS